MIAVSAAFACPSHALAQESTVAIDPGVASEGVRQVAGWAIASGDSGGLPFIVIDKVAAHVFLFGAGGEPLGAAPALLGIATGDDTAPGIGDIKMSKIPKGDRTTPAGRFVGRVATVRGMGSVLWVDYASAVALHAVVTSNKKERRLQRLNSPTPDDNRITFGCINVPTAFYADSVRPLFAKGGLVYILPEGKPLDAAIPGFRPQATAR